MKYKLLPLIWQQLTEDLIIERLNALIKFKFFIIMDWLFQKVKQLYYDHNLYDLEDMSLTVKEQF